jgi:NodT family efflux transporter outer membrane factor (OMF) lipoprotein
MPPDDWWRLYRDPTLDGFISEAFAANTDLRVAEANLSAARALLEASRSQQYPSTRIEAAAVHGRDPTTDEILELTGRAPATIWLYDDIFDMSYELDLFGRVRRTIEASLARADGVMAARDNLRVTIAAETTRAYALVCTFGEQLAVARHSLAVVMHQSEILTRRRDAGAGTDFDVVRAQGLVAQTRSNIPTLEGQRRAAVLQLAVLLGRAPQRAPLEVEQCVTPPHLDAPIPVGDGVALLKRRPDIREADRQVAAATAGIGIATADLYPRVTLSAFYGGVGTRLQDLTSANGAAWGVGPAVSWEFPNQLLARARIRQAKANTQAALANFDSTVLKALKETEQSLVNYSAELGRHDALLEAQQEAHRAFGLARGQYGAGSISTLDLLSTEQNLVLSDASAAASDAALVQDQIAIFKALGGGWNLQASKQDPKAP